MYQIIGLGNKGAKYEFSRHNTGFAVIESLRVDWDLEDWRFDQMKGGSSCRGEVAGISVELFKPDTFMNTSGDSVLRLKKRGLEPDRCIVIHDEIDLPLGVVKFVYGRGSGGHKGVESVIKAFGTKNFFRFRVGIAPVSESGTAEKPRGKDEVHRFILGKFTEKEKKEIKKASLRIGKYTENFLAFGFEKTISSFKG